MAVGAMAAIGGLSAMPAVSAAAAGSPEITISVFFDGSKNDHLEGLCYGAGPGCVSVGTPWTCTTGSTCGQVDPAGDIATFTDSLACTAGHGCAASDFTATINWGDPVSSDPGTVTEVSPGNYTVKASHAYADEFNPGGNPSCLNPPCTYHVHVAITDNVDGSTNRNDDVVSPTVGGIAVGDQGFGGPLTPNFFGATAGQTFSKAIGSFQDDNLLARPFDTLGPNEYTVTIYWGDGTAVDHSNLPVTVQPMPCVTTCTVYVNGSHTYQSVGTYNYIITVTDGADPAPGCSSNCTAYVTAARIAVKPAPAGSPGGRSAVKQSPAAAPGPRIAAGLSSSPTRVATRQTTDAGPAQSHGSVSTTVTATQGIAVRSVGRFDAKTLDQAGTLPSGSSTSLATLFNEAAGLMRYVSGNAQGAWRFNI
jgi:hypothetical protein